MQKKRVPEAVERVRRQFDDWRSVKERRDRIPERLWDAAVDAARCHGVNAVCRVARLEHAELSRRVQATAVESRHAPAFIELQGASSSSVGCVVELEKSNGTRMRICVRDGGSLDWSRMTEAFLGA